MAIGTTRGRRGRWSAAAAALVVAGCGGGGGDSGPGLPTGVQLKSSAAKLLEIRTVSNRADLISDGDALVELVLPERAALPSLKVALNGRDVTASFQPSADGRL